MPDKTSQTTTAAKEGLDYCNKLFAIERALAEEIPEKRFAQRLEQSKPVLEAFWAWLNTKKNQVLPKSTFGKAIAYCINQWDKLQNFLKDGRLEISNNRAERAIKPFVIGRKNYLFCNTAKGASASATIYSIVETAKANGLSPFHYLTYLFEKLSNIDLHDSEKLFDLLPWSANLPDSCRSPVKRS